MAGGFFSGGSSDAVNASVAEAEAAAREAEAARDEINDKFVEYAGQTEEGSYTVPNADDASTTKFLRQDGTWVVPVAGESAEELNDLTDVTLSNPTTNQFLRYNSVTDQWINQSVSLSAGINAGAGLDIDNDTDTIFIMDDGVITVMLADDNVTTAKIADDAITSAKIADAAVNATKLSDTGTDGQLLSTNADGDLEWINAAAGISYSASDGITLDDSDDFSLTDAGVTTVKLADGSVTTAKIVDGEITTAKIDDDAVTTDKILDANITTDKILDANVTAAKVADDAITTDKILDANVTEDKVADGAISTDKIGNAAVTNSKIVNSTIDETKLKISNTGTAGQILSLDNVDDQFTWVDAADAVVYTGTDGIDVTGTAISLEDDGVTTAKIADDAVDADKLSVAGTDGQLLSTDSEGNLAWVTPAEGTAYTASDGITLTGVDFTLTDDGVSTPKIADDAVDADKLNVTGDGTSGQILSSDGDGSFTWIDDASNVTYTASDGITLASNDFSLTDDGVSTVKIADLAVTAAKVANTSITAAKIANATITATQLADSSVGTDQLATNAVTTIKVTDLNITAAKLAANSVTNAKIMNGEVNEDKLDVSNTGTTGQLLSSDGDGTFTWVTESGGTQYTADGTTLALSAGNQFSIEDGGVGAAQLASNSVTSAKIANDNVGADELNVSGDGTSGQFLASDGDGTFTWTTGSTTLRGLTDTNIPASITNRRFLEYSPSDDRWDAVAITDLLNLHELFDVTLSSPTDNQFLRFDTNSAKWINESVSIPASLSGGTGITISSNVVFVTADGITNALLADNAVRTENIVDAMVTTAKIADGAVDTNQIASDAVTAAKIADNTITATQVAPNSLGATELATDSVSSFKLQDNAVISGKIANNVVGADELDVSGDGTSGQVLSSDGDGTFSWVANSGGGGTTYTAGTGLDLSDENQFSISDMGVDTAQIANNAITGTQLADNAVNTAELVDIAVTTAKIDDSAVTTAKINDSAITNGKLATGAVNTSKIFDGAITADKLGSGSVTTVKIGDTQVTTAKLATDIPVSTLGDVDTSGVNNGQILSYNGSTWVPINNSGGNTDNSRLAIALTPSSLNEGDDDVTVNVALSIANALTDETISGQSVTVTDPTGHSVNVDGSSNAWTFLATTTSPGNYVIRASATFTNGSINTVHSSSANLPVTANNTEWYQQVTATQPTAVSGMMDNGTFNSPETAILNGSSAPTNARKAYLALPTNAAGYRFNVGFLPASDLTDHGVISTNYTLYQVNDADFDDRQSGDLQLTITEL